MPTRKQSTGPKTAQGKARSSQNAFKHGLSSAQTFIPDHLKPLHQEITRDLREAILPEGTLEDDAAAQLCDARFQMERVRLLQGDLVRQSASRGLDPLADPTVQKQYDRLERYHRSAQATFRANMRELRKLQCERQNRYELFTADAVFPGLADMRQAFRLAHAEKRAAQNELHAAVLAHMNAPMPVEPTRPNSLAAAA